MSLIACGRIHEGHEWFSDDSRGRQEIFMCLAAQLCEQFCRFANEGAKISMSSPTSWDHLFFLSVFSSSEVLAKIYFHSSKLLLQLAGLGEKREEPVKPTCFMSKATSVPQTPQTNRSQCSSPVEALNLIVESKSQPVELDNSTGIELHLPSRRKNSLQSYCSVDFDFLACLLACSDMTFDVTSRDDSSFGKITNSCNFKNVSFSLLLVTFSVKANF